jgi:hypothetical protein
LIPAENVTPWKGIFISPDTIAIIMHKNRLGVTFAALKV